MCDDDLLVVKICRVGFVCCVTYSMFSCTVVCRHLIDKPCTHTQMYTAF